MSWRQALSLSVTVARKRIMRPLSGGFGVGAGDVVGGADRAVDRHARCSDPRIGRGRQRNPVADRRRRLGGREDQRPGQDHHARETRLARRLAPLVPSRTLRRHTSCRPCVLERNLVIEVTALAAGAGHGWLALRARTGGAEITPRGFIAAEVAAAASPIEMPIADDWTKIMRQVNG